METFFPQESPLRYWLCNASISHIACSVSWPPIIAVTGNAPCVRAWSPTSRDEPEFKPVQQLFEVDGERFVNCTVKGDLLVAADASSSGRISIWDTTTWARQQTLTAGAPVTSLDASRTYIAAGTSAGYVRVWKRQSAADATFTQFFLPDLQLDSLPVYSVKLGPLRAGAGTGGGGAAGGDGGGGDSVMVVHTRGNGRVSAWRLGDAKIIGTLGRSASLPPSELLLSANVLHACLAKDVLLTCSWVPGSDPLLQWIHPVQRAGGEVPGVTEHLAGVARPLSCDYDGFVIVMGCEDGMVWVWGLLQGQGQLQQPPQQHSPDVSHWRGYHQGAVGAVACLPHRSQVASAGADGRVKLWSVTGQLLAVSRLGWQVTTLAVNELALVAGGAEGQIQILVLLAEEQAAAGAARLTEEERLESQTPAPTRGSVTQYGYWFDARSPKAASAGAVAGPSGLVSEQPDAFAAFVPPRRQVLLSDLQQQQPGGGGGGGAQGGSQAASSSGAGGSGAGADGGGSSGAGAPASGDAAGGAAAAAGSGSASSKASSFNMQAALKGAQRSAADQAAALVAEEEAKRAQLRAMGEGPGVARSQGAVQLEGATAALGRKCANPSCLQREGLVSLQQAGAGFKRCGACKSVFYCSAHCQSTHWRDGHKKECPQLSEAWRQQQQAEQEQQQQQVMVGAGPGADAASSSSGGASASGGGGEPRPAPGDSGAGDAAPQSCEAQVHARDGSGGAAAAGEPAGSSGCEAEGSSGQRAANSAVGSSVVDCLNELD